MYGTPERSRDGRRAVALAALLALLMSATSGGDAAQAVARPRTIEAVQQRLGPAARARLRPHIERAGLAYPPARVMLLAFKDERRLEVWGRASASARPRFVRSYPVLAASGGPGPKLREGDGQVPEGLYRIPLLNPTSAFHLSMRVDYPNALDRAQARRDGRTRLGGDIYIHGNAVSIGCLAMGDEAIEELFVLAADVGTAGLRVLIAPLDLRTRELAPEHAPTAAWIQQLYASLRQELRQYPAPPPS
jgi:hypothetical protein